jgi:alcohol dehydrogenase class IV
VTSPVNLLQIAEEARNEGLTLPARLVFGNGTIAELPRLIGSDQARRRVFLVFGAAHGELTKLQDRIEANLKGTGFEPAGAFNVTSEPTTKMVDTATRLCRSGKAGIVLACGGGSVIDCGKATAAMATNPGSVRDYLEGVGNETLSARPLPFLAIPTTAGTGSEATRNAVLSVPDLGIKRSLRHPGLVPEVAILDPELTWSCPPAVTAASGMDALTQLVESCISIKRRPPTTRLALLGLRPVRAALTACHHNPESSEERAAMSASAFLSGVCLANSGLGLVHGIASGLGGLKDLAHGFICAVLLPHALRYNRAAAEPQLRESLAAFLNEPPSTSSVDRGIAAIEELKQTLGLPSDFRSLRLSPEEVREVAARSMGSSMSGNPVPMTAESVVDFMSPLTS